MRRASSGSSAVLLTNHPHSLMYVDKHVRAKPCWMMDVSRSGKSREGKKKRRKAITEVIEITAKPCCNRLLAELTLRMPWLAVSLEPGIPVLPHYCVDGPHDLRIRPRRDWLNFPLRRVRYVDGTPIVWFDHVGITALRVSAAPGILRLIIRGKGSKTRIMYLHHTVAAERANGESSGMTTGEGATR